MLKRLLALLLMLALIATMLVACNDKADKDDDEKDDEGTSQTDKEEKGDKEENGDKEETGDKEPAKKNNEETALKLVIDMMNAKTAKEMYEGYRNMLNGFADKEIDALIKAAKKENAEFEDQYIEQMESMLEDREGEYGADYKASYKLNGKSELDEDTLNEIQESFKEIGEEFSSTAADAPEEYADLARKMEALAEVLKNAEVTKGYKLEVTITQNDESEDDTLEVCLVDGVWISEASFAYLYMLLG